MGKKVKVKMPVFEDFATHYIPNSASGCYANNASKRPTQDNAKLGDLETTIEINGQVVDISWLQS